MLSENQVVSILAKIEGKLAEKREEIIDFIKNNPKIFNSIIASYSLVPVMKLNEDLDVIAKNAGIEINSIKIEALIENLTYCHMLYILTELHSRTKDEENENKDMDN